VSGSRESAPAVGSSHPGRRARHPGRRPRCRPFPTRILFATLNLLLKHLDTTVATYKRRQMKHLKQVSETLAKTSKKTFENHCKYMQHPNETLASIRMKHLKTLEIYACNMHVYATFISTFATSRQNTCNIHLERMKHLQHTLETYVYSHYKHVQHPDLLLQHRYTTLATYL
jgi:hypothetical protein